MSSSTPNPHNQTTPASANPPPPERSSAPPQTQSSPAAPDPPPQSGEPHAARRGTFLMLSLGLVAGVLAWFLVEHFHLFFTLPRELADKNPPYDPETEKQIFAAAAVRDYKNMALTYGMIGLVLCALLGLGKGVLRRSSGAALGGLLLGALLGAATGVAAGSAVIAIREQLNMVFSVDLFSTSINLGAYQKAAVMHVAAWIIVSLGVGLTVGLLGPNKARAAVRCFAASAAAGLVIGLLFPIIAAIVLPFEKPELPRPEGSWTVLLWTVTVCTIIGWAVGRVSRAEPRNAI